MKVFKVNVVSLGLLSVLLFALTFALTGCGIFNQPPTAEISTTPEAEDGKVTVGVGDEINFDGGNSKPNGGEITEYFWDFKSNNGGEVTDKGKEVTHSYDETGTFVVTLKVTDDGGGTDTAEVEIVVELEPPPPP